MPNIEIQEVMKEYLFYVDGVSHPIKGRICQRIGVDRLPFTWHISHYCKPSEEAGVYRPSKVSGDTFGDVYELLTMYAKAFTDIGVTPNERY